MNPSLFGWIKHVRPSLFFLAFFIWSAPSVYADTFPGRVVYVNDGDTLVVRTEKKRELKCRIYGIDAPELKKRNKPGQKFGQAASDFLKELAEGKLVSVLLTGEKTYGREVCVVYLEGKDVGLLMLETGLVWAYRKHLKPPYRESYMEAEKRARNKKRGLWQDKASIPPWKFKYLYW